MLANTTRSLEGMMSFTLDFRCRSNRCLRGVPGRLRTSRVRGDLPAWKLVLKVQVTRCVGAGCPELRTCPCTAPSLASVSAEQLVARSEETSA